MYQFKRELLRPKCEAAFASAALIAVGLTWSPPALAQDSPVIKINAEAARSDIKVTPLRGGRFDAGRLRRKYRRPSRTRPEVHGRFRHWHLQGQAGACVGGTRVRPRSTHVLIPIGTGTTRTAIVAA